MKKSHQLYFVKQKLTVYTFVLPAVIFMALMIILPIGYNIVMSFENVDLMNFTSKTKNFVGFDVYKSILTNSVFYIALKNTLIFTFWCLVFQFPLGFAMAMFYSLKFKMAEFLRGITVVAWMVPMVAVAGVFKYMFNGDIGIINELLVGLHLISKPIQWLSNGDTAMTSIIIANVWKGIPFNMILLATALTTMPTDVYEAASIDGANAFQRFTRITIPLLKPAMISVLTLGFIYTFKVFDLVYVMTGGGPGSSTEVLSTLAYRYSFTEYNFSQGAAAANVLFVLLSLVGLIYIHIVRKEEDQ
jgi:multiple sugar transport system permease protein